MSDSNLEPERAIAIAEALCEVLMTTLRDATSAILQQMVVEKMQINYAADAMRQLGNIETAIETASANLRIWKTELPVGYISTEERSTR